LTLPFSTSPDHFELMQAFRDSVPLIGIAGFDGYSQCLLHCFLRLLNSPYQLIWISFLQCGSVQINPVWILRHGTNFDAQNWQGLNGGEQTIKRF
jgi:hypothetical protein